MSIYDANYVPAGTQLTCEVCIAGGGVAGITLALELEAKGLSVILLESGELQTNAENESLNEIESIGKPLRQNFHSRIRALGGTSLVWGGGCMRMLQIDLTKRSWIPESGWPLAFSELQGYYDRAEHWLALPALAKLNNHSELPRIETNELDMFNSVDLAPRTILWGIHAKRYGRAYKKMLNRQSRAVTYVNATVTDIVLNESGGHVERIEITSKANTRFTIKARHSVLACGGLENARLLLTCTKQQTNGIGNLHDNVGRYYMDHPRTIAGQVRLAKPMSLQYLLRAPVNRGAIQLGIGLSDKAQQQEQTLNSYLSLEPQISRLASSRVDRKVRRFDKLQMGIAQARKVTERVNRKLYSDALTRTYYRNYILSKRYLRQRFVSPYLTVLNHCEQVPDPTSRAYLSSNKDRFGIPKLVLDWRINESEVRSLACLHDRLGRHLQTSGIGTLEKAVSSDRTPEFTDASHHIGTTRMSQSEKTGVVDANCKVHGVDNLYVAGSSVFPTSGHANPTLTIVALTLRLGDYLRNQSRSTF